MKINFLYLFTVLLAVVLLTGCAEEDPIDTEPKETAELEEIGVEMLAEGFVSPVAFVSPEDGTGRMFVVDQGDPYSIPDDNPFVGEEGRDEIFAYGFRNPYRISFDAMGDNELFVADVGQDLWEEVNIVTKGGNYGWNIKEGTHCFDPENPEEPPEECPDVGPQGEPLIDPILEYRNARNEGIGIAVIGGYVYRGEAINDLVGDYLFADWSLGFGEGDGTVFAASSANDDWDFREMAISNKANQRLGSFITGIGQDADNELYLLTTENSGPKGNTGKVFKVVPANDETVDRNRTNY